LVGPTEEGTPQGGPLSPLLSNLMLDVLDKELEKRSHRFVRYADDCNTYMRSQRAGERVMSGIKANTAKSAVAKPSVRKFLGFSFTGGEQPRLPSCGRHQRAEGSAWVGTLASLGGNVCDAYYHVEDHAAARRTGGVSLRIYPSKRMGAKRRRANRVCG
jgi:hypothetical protein